MIITCPNCSTQYDIDDARIPSQGRTLLCAVCSSSWFVPAPEPVGNLIRVNNPPQPAHQPSYAQPQAPAQHQSAPLHNAQVQPSSTQADQDQPQSNQATAADAKAAAEQAPQKETQDTDPFASVDRLGADRNDEWLKRAKKPASDEGKQNASSNTMREGPAADVDGEPDLQEGQKQKKKKGLFKKKAARAAKEDESEQFLAFADQEAPVGVPEDVKKEANPAVVDAEFEDLQDADEEDAPDTFDVKDRVDDQDEAVLSATRLEEDDEGDRIAPEDRKMRKGIFLSDDDDEDNDHDEDDDARPRRLFGRSKKSSASTALATTDALDEAAARVFNDEFFKALRVQPKELEKAIRRARRRAEAREKNRLTPLRFVSWILWMGAVVASLSAAYAYRTDIVALWPRANVAYTAVGIEIAPQTLEITRINHRLIMSDEGPEMEVTGVLINKTEKTLAAPLMQAEASGADGAVLARWTFKVDSERTIPSEGAAPFKTRAAAPAGVAEITISFAPKNPGPRIGPDVAE